MIPQNHLPTSLDEKSVHDILIKLPINSLMRFKCVSKRWQSLIQDPSFVKSHLSRSKTNPQLLIKIYDHEYCSEVILAPEDGFEGGVALHKVRIPWAIRAYMFKQSIDGLFCYVDNPHALTCIYNLGTRQVTPWAQSCIPIQGGEGVKHKAIYGFGFDPLTNNYKLLRDWEISRYGNDYEMGRVDHVCEVFTVGEQWRKIDEVPPLRLRQYGGVYANGSVYWTHSRNAYEQQDNEVIVAFDVGTERFRVVEIPNFILGVSRNSDEECSKDLLQIDGHIAIMDRVDVQVLKLWISDDDSCNKEKTTNWTEETLSLPFPFYRMYPVYVYPVEGTDKIVIETFMPPRDRGLYVYDRTMKSFQTIDITGIPPKSTSSCEYYIFHESLVPVQKPPAEEEKLDQLITSLALV